jgi:large subunit ribosomal protein L22
MATEAVKENKKVLVRASARSLRLAPRKMRLVTNLVKGMRASEAITQLQFTNKKGADMVIKLIRSAVANAENNFSLNADNLYIQSITCDMGATLQRYFPRARGSAFVIRRKMCHVNLILEEREGKKSAKSSRFALPKRDKKSAPVKTQEGSVGIPAETTEKLSRAKSKKTAPTEHAENKSETVKEKSGPDESQSASHNK